ncbi:MAG: hypothetical protein JO249_00390 [Acidobacteria bacterium]|nr:hypothetical protein [Acidobacteriota bacterium]
MKRMAAVALLLPAALSLSFRPTNDSPRTFHGETADSQCSMNVHSLTRSHQEMLKSKSMGGDATSCTLYCIRYMGGEFVLTTPNDVFYVDSTAAAHFAGQKVVVVGFLDEVKDHTRQ